MTQCIQHISCQCTRRFLHSAPIDIQPNKKFEFVYSLVTQIRERRSAMPASSFPLCTLFYHPLRSRRFLPTQTSLFLHRHRRCSSRVCHWHGTAQRKQDQHRQITQMPSVNPGRIPRRHHHHCNWHRQVLVSLYFSPLFPWPFRSVRRVCRTICPSWPRMHLSNGETNW